MSVLVVGISHNSAPVALLERLALDADGACTSWCSDVVALRARHRGHRARHLQPARDLRRGRPLPRQRRGASPGCSSSGPARRPRRSLPHLYVHYDDGAVSHLFHVAAGLDSMVVGEGQILGQTREALRVGQELGTVGPALNVLFQQALRVGKRVARRDRHRPGRPVPGHRRARPRSDAAVGDARRQAGRRRRRRRDGRPGHRDRRPAGRRRRRRRQPHPRPAPPGSPSSTTPARRRSSDARRRARRADVLSPAPAPPGCWSPLDDGRGRARRRAARWRSSTWRCRTTSTPPSADLPGVTLIGLADLADELHDADAGREVAEVRADRRRGGRGVPRRPPPGQRHPDRRRAALDGHRRRRRRDGPARHPAARPRRRRRAPRSLHAVRRVADKLLHQPTVRVKELANETGAVSYAAALAELFALDPDGRRRRHPAGGAVVSTVQQPVTTRRSVIRVGTRALPARPHPVRARRRRCSAPRSAATSSWSRSPPRATAPGVGAPLAGVGGTGVFVSALRDALLRGEVDVAVHSLKDLPDRPARGHRARRRPAARGPARRRRGPRRAHPRRAAGRQPRRHRLAAPGRPAARARPRSGGRRHPRQRRHPDRQGPLRRVRRRRARPRRAGPARPARRGHRGARPAADAPRPRAGCAGGRVPGRRRRARGASSRRARRPRTPARPSTAERAVLATLEAGCSAPVGALAEVVEGDDGDELWVRAVALSPTGRSRCGCPRPAPPDGRRGRRRPAGRARCSPTGRRLGRTEP